MHPAFVAELQRIRIYGTGEYEKYSQTLQKKI